MSETKELWVNVYEDSPDCMHTTKEGADAKASRNRIRCDRYVLADPPPPAEAPSEPSVEEERWAFFHPSDRKLCLSHTHQGGKTVGGERLFPVIVRSKAADDELRAELEAVRSCVADAACYEAKAEDRIADLEQQLSDVARERDELKQQLADAINSQVDATEQLEHERQSYETLVHEAVELRRQVSTLTRERDEARSVVDLKLLERGLREGIEQRARIATLTAERDDLSRKLAVAEGELTLVRQERDEARSEREAMESQLATSAAHRELKARELQEMREQRDAYMDLNAKNLIEKCARIAELERQLEEARDAYEAERGHRLAAQAAMQSMLADQQPPSCAAATPIEPDKRSGDAPSVYINLDGVQLNDLLSATYGGRNYAVRVVGTPEHPFVPTPPSSGPADEGWMEKAVDDFGNYIKYSTSWLWSNTMRNRLAAACRAALDSRKERADG